jgi:hypothetical protein
MEAKPALAVDFEEAKRLADAVSIFQDLTSTAAALARLEELMAENKEKKREIVEIPSLWTAALIGYARCFAHGMRYRLKEDLFAGFDPSALEFHRYLIGMRDKHVAHAVNPFEEVAVGLVLANEDSAQPEVAAVAWLSRRLLVTTEESVADFRHLVEGIRSIVAEDCKRFEAEVLAVARKLDPAQLKSLPRLQMVTPGPADVLRPRK